MENESIDTSILGSSATAGTQGSACQRLRVWWQHPLCPQWGAFVHPAAQQPKPQCIRL